MKNKVLIITGLFMCMLALSSCAKKSYLDSKDAPLTEEMQLSLEEPEEEPKPKGSIYVQLTGAVNNPGVYETESDARLFTVIEMAGGLREDAAFDGINQAGVVTDGQSIHIPTIMEMEEAKALADSGSGGFAADGRVNINTASKEELMSLPGIGESKASMIIEYRETNGSYAKSEDIMNIQGIKEGVFSKIKDSITVGN